MERQGIDLLTDEELRALQAYAEEGSRKGAANVLGKSESTIATQLAGAREKLGVPTTTAAVKLLRTAPSPHPEWISSPRPIAAIREPAEDQASKQEALSRSEVRDVEMLYVPHPPRITDLLSARTQGRQINDLTGPQRLIVIVAFMALVVIAMALAPLVAEGVQRWAHRQAEQH